jgi:hypothetical protein
VSRWKTGVLSVIDQQIIGVVSTETDIWFFEKGVKISNAKFQNQKKIESEIEIEFKKLKK